MLTAGGGFDSAKAITLNAAGGTILTDPGTVSIFSGPIGGSGSLTKSGAGALFLTGAGTYTGGTIISGGLLAVGNGGNTGSITGNVVDNGVLAFERSDPVIFWGNISGSGSFEQLGPGTLTLTGINTFSGGVLIANWYRK